MNIRSLKISFCCLKLSHSFDESMTGECVPGKMFLTGRRMFAVLSHHISIIQHAESGVDKKNFSESIPSHLLSLAQTTVGCKYTNESTPFAFKQEKWIWVVYWQPWHHSFSPIVLKLETYFCENSVPWGGGGIFRGGDHQVSCPPPPKATNRNFLSWKYFSLQGSWNRIFNIPQSRGSARFPCLCYCLVGHCWLQSFLQEHFILTLVITIFPVIDGFSWGQSVILNLSDHQLLLI